MKSFVGLSVLVSVASAANLWDKKDTDKKDEEVKVIACDDNDAQSFNSGAYGYRAPVAAIAAPGYRAPATGGPRVNPGPSQGSTVHDNAYPTEVEFKREIEYPFGHQGYATVDDPNPQSSHTHARSATVTKPQVPRGYGDQYLGTAGTGYGDSYGSAGYGDSYGSAGYVADPYYYEGSEFNYDLDLACLYRLLSWFERAHGSVTTYGGIGGIGGIANGIGGIGGIVGGIGSSYGGVGPSYGGVGPSYGGVGPSYGGVGPSYGGVGPSYGGVGPSYGGVGPTVNPGPSQGSTRRQNAYPTEVEYKREVEYPYGHSGYATYDDPNPQSSHTSARSATVTKPQVPPRSYGGYGGYNNRY